MNILAYVHLRNIYGSTGHGRVARQITEHLAQVTEDTLHILVDPEDHRKVVHKVGAPWTEFAYHFFNRDTSRQQAHWVFTGRPLAEHYWPDAEIVYCTYDSYVPTRRAKLVVTLHDAAIFESDALPHRWLFYRERLKSELIYRILSRKADLIHTVSHFSAERLAHFFPTLRSRLRVVHNAVSPCFFLPISAVGKQALKEFELIDRPFVLLPGGLNYRKNADLVLRAWPLVHQMHPEVQLVVAGHCEPDYLGPGRALGESARLTGFVNDEVLCALYDAAQVVWFPSLYEGFGLPVLEAMARGTAVVASNSTSLPEVAGDAALLASPSSVAEQVEALDALLKDSRMRELLSKRGKLRAESFTWPRAAAQLRRHFLSLI
ncbi:MAG: glycosyltransferase family 1 protein [Acidobacteriota bacterium]